MRNRVFFIVTRALAVAISAVFILVILYLLYKGFKYFSLDLFSSELLAPLSGTIALIFMSVIIALPLGIASAIYIEFYAPKRVKGFLDFSFDILASVPSIIMGLFGFAILLGLHALFSEVKSSLLLASLSVAFLILPYITKSAQLGFRDVLPIYKSIGYSLGATKEQLIKKIVLPFAREHIIKGVLLSVARASEDTAVIMLTGVVASYGMVDGLLKPFEALPFFIYYTSANYASGQEFNAIYVAVLMLLGLSFSIILLLRGKFWLR
jgi:phosphate transport system permease protein